MFYRIPSEGGAGHVSPFFGSWRDDNGNLGGMELIKCGQSCCILRIWKRTRRCSGAVSEINGSLILSCDPKGWIFKLQFELVFKPFAM